MEKKEEVTITACFDNGEEDPCFLIYTKKYGYWVRPKICAVATFSLEKKRMHNPNLQKEAYAYLLNSIKNGDLRPVASTAEKFNISQSRVSAWNKGLGIKKLQKQLSAGN